MHHPIHARQNVYKGAKVLNRHHGAGVGAADFGLFHQAFDPSQRLLNRLTIGAGNGNQAVFFNIHLGARFASDFVDGFATLANDGANFIRVNLELFDARRIGAELFTRCWQHTQHVL